MLAHDLLSARFIPSAPQRELTRYRKTLVQERAQEVNRLHKVLEGANVKLTAVATAVLGKSGRLMLAALLGGEQDAEALAELARGRLRAKLPELRLALDGRIQPHHRFLLSRILAEVAWAIAHTKDNYLWAFYHRGAANRKPSWRSATKCWSFSIISGATRSTTRI